MFGGAKAGWTGSTEPYIKGDTQPPEKKPLYKKWLGAIMRIFRPNDEK